MRLVIVRCLKIFSSLLSPSSHLESLDEFSGICEKSGDNELFSLVCVEGVEAPAFFIVHFFFQDDDLCSKDGRKRWEKKMQLSFCVMRQTFRELSITW